MRPRFTILALLCVTAYLALVFGAVAAPVNQPVNALAFYCWIGIVVFLAVEASQATSAKSVFARGCFLTTFVYFTMASATKDYLWPGPELPSTYIIAWLNQRAEAPPGSSDYQKLIEFRAGEYIWRHVIGNFALAFGLLGGCLAVWRYRRLERRENADE